MTLTLVKERERIKARAMMSLMEKFARFEYSPVKGSQFHVLSISVRANGSSLRFIDPCSREDCLIIMLVALPDRTRECKVLIDSLSSSLTHYLSGTPCLSVGLSVCQSVCLCMSVGLTVSLSLCLSLSPSHPP